MSAAIKLFKEIAKCKVDPEYEPVEEVTEDDLVIGEISVYSRKIWCLICKLTKEMEALKKLISNSSDPELISHYGELEMRYEYLTSLFWLEQCTDFAEKYPDIWMVALVETLGVRKGWLFVWRERTESDEVQEVEFTSERDQRYDDEEEGDNPSPPNKKRIH